MTYFIKRTYYAITYRSKWLLLALFPPLVFLVMSAITPDRYMVSQDLTLAAQPELTPAFVYSLVSSRVFNENGSEKHMILRPSQTRELYFLLPSSSAVRIVYEGANRDNGSNLVNHYYDRLQRNLLDVTRAGAADTSYITTKAAVVEPLRSMWRAERVGSLLQYAGISLLLMIAVLLCVEFFDPSFKSERAAARYLGLPMLGSLPNAEPLLKSMKASRKTAKNKLGVLEEASTTS